MSQAKSTVVRKVDTLPEDHFHSVFMQSLSRMICRHGKSTVALWMGVSVRQLGNIQAGSLPTADKIWNLLAHDSTAHDEIDAEYGQRNVPIGAVCSTDPVAEQMAALLAPIIRAECKDSDGGSTVTDAELRMMDDAAIRRAAQTFAGYVARLDAMSRPSSLRAVGGAA